MKTFALLILLAVSASAQNVTNLYIGQQLYIGKALSSVPSSGGGGGGTNITLFDSTTANTSANWAFGSIPSEYYVAQREFITTSNVTIYTIQARLQAVGTITNRTIYAEVWSTNGANMGTLLSSSSAVPGSDSWTGLTTVTFNFPSPFTITNGVFYDIVIDMGTNAASLGSCYTIASTPSSIPGFLNTMQWDKTPGTGLGTYDLELKLIGSAP